MKERRAGGQPGQASGPRARTFGEKAMKTVPLCLAAATVLLGCSGSEGSRGPSTSTVRGAVEASTFPGIPSAVAAFDEGDRSIRTSLDAHSAFSLRLPKGHTYRLVVS